jgi:hypothetical protein
VGRATAKGPRVILVGGIIAGSIVLFAIVLLVRSIMDDGE